VARRNIPRKIEVMDRNVPTIVIEPVVLFREGLRRILWEASFQVFWCADHAPPGQIPALPASAAPLVIIGTNFDEAIVQIGEVKRQYPDARIVLLVEPGPRQQVLAALRCGADTLIHRRSSYEAFIGTLKLVIDGATVLPSDMIDVLLSEPDEPAPSDACPPTSLNGVGESEEHQEEVLAEELPHEELLADEVPATEDLAPVELAASEITTGELVQSDIAPPSLPHTALVPGGLVQRSIAQQDYGLSLRELGVLDRLREGRSNKEIARDLGITEATVKVHVKAILRKARMRNRTQVAMWASRMGVGQHMHHQADASH
jgi:two-component system, NarL family, nitrate/nitrite response regulator NarL